MHRQDEEDIDRLFSAGSDEHNYSYNPEAWALLETQLDAKEATKITKKRGIIILLLVFLGGLTAYLLPSKSSDKSNQIELSQEESRTTEKQITSMPTPLASTGKHQLGGDLAKTTRKSGDVTALKTQHKVVESAVLTDNTIDPLASTKKEVGYDAIVRQPSDQTMATLPSVNQQSTTKTAQVAVTYNDLSNDTPTLSDMTTETSANATTEIPEINLLQSEISPIAINRAKIAIGQPPIVIRPLQSKSRLSLSILAGPEWSALRKDSNPAIGRRAGIRLGYQIGPRWSIQAGIIWSKKLFNGAGSEFDPNYFSDAIPMRMEGKSSFVEIPVTVQYHIAGGAKSNWYLEAGVTNFNHRSEWYGFEYEPEDIRPGLMVEIPEQSVNKMTFGAIRLSTGYQYSISKRSQIGVAPYVQIPLRGIGAGNVSIFNTGLELFYTFR